MSGVTRYEPLPVLKSVVSRESKTLEESRILWRIRREFDRRTSPDRVVRWWWLLFPWTKRAKLRMELSKAAEETRVGIYQGELKSIRRAAQLLNRYSRLRALVISGIAATELRARGEAHRFETVTRTRSDLTGQFLGGIDAVNNLDGGVPTEFKDALKERVFNDYMETLNRSSRILAADAYRRPQKVESQAQGKLWKE